MHPVARSPHWPISPECIRRGSGRSHPFASALESREHRDGRTAPVGRARGEYEDSFKGPDGKTVHEKRQYVCTRKKQKDGAWKAILDIWSSDPN
jgi:ketosteroid isomerase-like protein